MHRLHAGWKPFCSHCPSSALEILTFFEIQNGSPAILDFHDKWIWDIPPWRLFVSWVVTEIGSTISYSRWVWSTFVPDIRLMTLCELTSCFGFGHVVICAWSCCIFLPNCAQTSSSKFNMVAVRRLGFDGGCRGTTHEGPFMVAISCKNSSWSA